MIGRGLCASPLPCYTLTSEEGSFLPVYVFLSFFLTGIFLTGMHPAASTRSFRSPRRMRCCPCPARMGRKSVGIFLSFFLSFFLSYRFILLSFFLTGICLLFFFLTSIVLSFFLTAIFLSFFLTGTCLSFFPTGIYLSFFLTGIFLSYLPVSFFRSFLPVHAFLSFLPVYFFLPFFLSHVLASAEIANIRCLRLVNEHTAIALSYSVFKDAKVRVYTLVSFFLSYRYISIILPFVPVYFVLSFVPVYFFLSFVPVYFLMFSWGQTTRVYKTGSFHA
jgi:hypothetical protein